MIKAISITRMVNYVQRTRKRIKSDHLVAKVQNQFSIVVEHAS